MAVNPGPGQRLLWGRLGGGGGPRPVAPRGSSGELPPMAGSGRELAPGAAFPRPAEPRASPRAARGGRRPPQRRSRLRPELDPPRSRADLQFVRVNYLLGLAASPAAAPPASALPAPGALHSLVCGGPCVLPGVPKSGPGQLGPERSVLNRGSTALGVRSTC